MHANKKIIYKKLLDTMNSDSRAKFYYLEIDNYKLLNIENLRNNVATRCSNNTECIEKTMNTIKTLFELDDDKKKQYFRTQ